MKNILKKILNKKKVVKKTKIKKKFTKTKRSPKISKVSKDLKKSSSKKLLKKNIVKKIPVKAAIKKEKVESKKWLELNTKYAEIWPNITEKKAPPEDHKKYENEENKFEKYFKENL